MLKKVTKTVPNNKFACYEFEWDELDTLSSLCANDFDCPSAYLNIDKSGDLNKNNLN